MLFQREYHPDKNYLTIHLDRVLTKLPMQVFENEEWTDDRDKEEWGAEEMPIFVKDLFSNVPGIAEIELRRHELTIIKGIVCEWDTIINKVIFVLQMHFEPKGTTKEIAPPITVQIDENGMRRETSKNPTDKLYSSDFLSVDDKTAVKKSRRKNIKKRKNPGA